MEDVTDEGSRTLTNIELSVRLIKYQLFLPSVFHWDSPSRLCPKLISTIGIEIISSDSSLSLKEDLV